MRLTTFRADFHVHTCLSPCADEDMKPRAIVRRAKERGVDIIGICDHNSTRNVAAVRRASESEGVTIIGGIEITSAEEVHMLGLFDAQESLQEIQRVIAENLKGENNALLFGGQLLCDEHDAVVGDETALLIGASELSVEEVVETILGLGGVAIASHVDRVAFGLIGQLGFVPRGLQIDALEISPSKTPERAKACFPEIRGFPLVRSSDAHRLEDIGAVSTRFTGASPSVAEFRMAIRDQGGRGVIN